MLPDALLVGVLRSKSNVSFDRWSCSPSQKWWMAWKLQKPSISLPQGIMLICFISTICGGKRHSSSCILLKTNMGSPLQQRPSHNLREWSACITRVGRKGGQWRHIFYSLSCVWFQFITQPTQRYTLKHLVRFLKNRHLRKKWSSGPLSSNDTKM